MYVNYFYISTSVDTEMCCPKDKCGCQYFILLTLDWTLGGGGGLWWKFEIKTQDQTLNKNNNPGLVYY
jgi:hypothetical protein